MSEVSFTFRVDEELKAEFSKLAKEQDRTPAQLLRDYMRSLIKKKNEEAEYDAWFREQAQIGIEQANAGNTIPAEEVEKEAAAWREETRRKFLEDAA